MCGGGGRRRSPPPPPPLPPPPPPLPAPAPPPPPPPPPPVPQAPLQVAEDSRSRQVSPNDSRRKKLARRGKRSLSIALNTGTNNTSGGSTGVSL